MSIQAEENPKILFLDIEGVMTRGMFSMRPIMQFLVGVDGRYSEEATRHVRRLVSQYGFRLVLITRHGRNESADLKNRLEKAGIKPEWLYGHDPDAIPDGTQTKGDAIMAWFKRNPRVKIENTVAVDDDVDQLIVSANNGLAYPAERIVSPNSDIGMSSKEVRAVLKLVGIDSSSPAIKPTAHQELPKLSGQ